MAPAQYAYYTSDAAPTTLASSLGSSGNPSVASVAGLPSSLPYKMLIDWGLTTQEAILVTSAPTGGGPYSLPCTRGFDGTTAQSHTSGAQVVLGTAADEYNILASTGLTVTGSRFGADPTGTNFSDAAFASVASAAQSTGLPVIVSAGQYKLQNPLNWKQAGLVVIGPGSGAVTLLQTTANTPIAEVAGQGQRIQGMTLKYSSQQTSGDTSGLGLQFGDLTSGAGSSFMSAFEDLCIEQSYQGLAINPAISGQTTAGLFSCAFRNIRIFGWYQNAIYLVGNAGGGLADCTGCSFDNTYCHNNFTGSPADSISYPVFLGSWSELVFNQLNIEKTNSHDTDVIGLAGVNNFVCNSLHLEGIQLSGSSGNSGYIYVDTGQATVNGMTVQFSTMNGSVDNPVARLGNGSGGPSSVTINGFWEPASGNSFATPHPWVDFGSITNGSFAVSNVVASQVSENYINGAAGSTGTVTDGAQVTCFPSAALPVTALAVAGLTGGTAGTRWVGAIASGTAPVSGTFATGDVMTVLTGGIIVCTSGGTQGTWVLIGGGGGFSNPMTTLGDLIDGGASGTAGRLAGPTSATKNFLTSTGTGSAAQAPAWGTLASGDIPANAANTSGTASNITDTLDQVPAPAANVSLNSHKITSLANGSGAQDAAAFGQLPSSGTPLALASGGTGVSAASDSALLTDLGAAALAGATFTGPVVASGGLTPAVTGWTVWPTGLGVDILNNTSLSGTAPAAAGDIYYSSCYIGSNCTLTGIMLGVGSVGGTDSWIAILYSSAGAVLANSSTSGIAVGSSASKQKFAFTSTYAATGPGLYYIGLQSNGTTAKFQAYINSVEAWTAALKTGNSFGTLTLGTPATTYTGSQGPVACTY